MKTLGLKMVSLFFLMVGGVAVMGQPERQEVPGDYFSLEGALELFKKSASPEEFERQLNSPHSKVNNLDLNADGEIDYIRVIDRNEGNVHAFIIQAIVSSTESQDVAVIELEKLANGKAVLQITGDADVYGIETIIEPTEEVRTYAGTTTSRVVVNVWAWPSVQYVYSPYYTMWISPWDWYYRPIWWFSWRPISYYEYYSYWQPYSPYYSYCHTHRVEYAQHIYRPYRTSSPVYYHRHNTQIVKYREHHNNGDRGNHYGFGRGDHGDKGNHYGNNGVRGNSGIHGNNGNHYGNNGNHGNSGNDHGNNGNGNNGDHGNNGNHNGNSGNHFGNDKSNRDNNIRSTEVKKSWAKIGERGNDRSESFSKPKGLERSSNSQSRNFERPTNKSQIASHSERGSHQRESRSIERSDNKGRSSGGGDEKRSGNRGNGKR